MCFGGNSSPAPTPPTTIPAFPPDAAEQGVTKTVKPDPAATQGNAPTNPGVTAGTAPTNTGVNSNNLTM